MDYKKINKEQYPQKIKEIINFPKELYVQGNIELLYEPSIAVVGTRNPSRYGEKMCKNFTKELVKNNFVIVSGLAKGIDTVAHSTCLENGGKTIAVLPSGFNNIYPKENCKLYKDIINLGGAIVTEYDINERANYSRFLERNRIVTALGVGTLIIEAGYRSGTSVTARITKEQGKKVFCIPSSLENRNGVMGNEIIRKGGILVTAINDIISEFPKEILPSQKENNENKKLEIKIDKEFLDIYNILPDRKPMHIDEIIQKSGLKANEVNYKLMMLEIENAVLQISGRRFVKNR